jgi:hypothetical protein
MYGTVFNTVSSAAPPDSTVSEDAGIQPRIVSTTALTVRRSNHSAKSHPQSAKSQISSLKFFQPQPAEKRSFYRCTSIVLI